jgi:Zn finger protein HypA/HybF involved in hydrogenase expression
MMHEFGIVESILVGLLPELEKNEVRQVREVHFQRGSAFSEDALRQAFAACADGTVLQDASLVITTVNLDYTCPCGHRQIINSDDLEGHMFICPECGRIHEVSEAHDLELTGVVAETEKVG